MLENLVREYFYSFIGFISDKGLFFLLNIFIARMYGSKYLGYFTIYYSTMVTSSIIAIAGLNNGILKFVNTSDKHDSGFVATSSLLFAILSSILATIMLLFFRNYIHRFIYSNSPINIYSVFSFFVFSYSINLINQATFISRNRVKYNAIFKFFWALLVAFSMLYVYLTEREIIIFISLFISAYTFISFSSIILAFYKGYYSNIFFTSHLIDKRKMKKLFRFSLCMLSISIISICAGKIDRIIIGRVVGASLLGVFSAAFSISSIPSLFMRSFNSIFGAFIADNIENRNYKKLSSHYVYFTKWIILITLPIYLTFFLNPESVLMIFGKEFVSRESINLFRILLIGGFIQISVGSVGTILSYSGHHKLHFIDNIIFNILYLLVLYIGSVKYSIIGSGIVYAVVFALFNIIRLYQIQKIFNIIPYNKTYFEILLFTPIITTLISILNIGNSFSHLISRLIVVYTPIFIYYFIAKNSKEHEIFKNVVYAYLSKVF